MGQKPGFARSDSGEPAVSLSKGRLSPHKALDGEVLALKFRFNAWAKYSNWRHDEKVGSLMAKGARTREIRPLSGERRIVLELLHPLVRLLLVDFAGLDGVSEEVAHGLEFDVAQLGGGNSLSSCDGGHASPLFQLANDLLGRQVQLFGNVILRNPGVVGIFEGRWLARHHRGKDLDDL